MTPLAIETGPWFFAPDSEWGNQQVVLPPDESHHATAVLRVTAPDVITVTDGEGRVARCAVVRLEGDRVIADVLEETDLRPPKPRVVIYQGAAKGTKVDGAIERLAELGVAEVWVYGSARTVVSWDAAKLDKLEQRWRAIARSAGKQSRNPHFMQTAGGLSFTELARRIAKEQLAVVLWEGASLPLRTALVEGCERIALVVGPEGGLAREEAEALADAGAQLVTLGPHILRTELAPVAAASALMYRYGLLG